MSEDNCYQMSAAMPAWGDACELSELIGIKTRTICARHLCTKCNMTNFNSQVQRATSNEWGLFLLYWRFKKKCAMFTIREIRTFVFCFVLIIKKKLLCRSGWSPMLLRGWYCISTYGKKVFIIMNRYNFSGKITGKHLIFFTTIKALFVFLEFRRFRSHD